MIIIRKEFGAWLRTKTPRQKGGRLGDSKHCLLANFLRDKTKKEVDVRSHYFTVDSIDEKLPEWAKEFIHEVDGLTRENGYPLKYITYGRALKILEAL